MFEILATLIELSFFKLYKIYVLYVISYFRFIAEVRETDFKLFLIACSLPNHTMLMQPGLQYRSGSAGRWGVR